MRVAECDFTVAELLPQLPFLSCALGARRLLASDEARRGEQTPASASGPTALALRRGAGGSGRAHSSQAKWRRSHAADEDTRPRTGVVGGRGRRDRGPGGRRGVARPASVRSWDYAPGSGLGRGLRSPGVGRAAPRARQAARTRLAVLTRPAVLDASGVWTPGAGTAALETVAEADSGWISGGSTWGKAIALDPTRWIGYPLRRSWKIRSVNQLKSRFVTASRRR